MKTKTLALPPTRNHRQLAAWINTQHLVDADGREVCARVESWRTNTDTRVAGTRCRRIGKGRQGLRLEIWLTEKPAALLTYDEVRAFRLYRHESGETYRRHSEARAWIEQNLRSGA